jgi:ferric iron reductase protein FhuF
MIDFSDPKTDVQEMLSDFKKFIRTKYNKDGRFDVVGLANWIKYDTFCKYDTYKDDYLYHQQQMDDAKALVSVWLSCGLLTFDEQSQVRTPIEFKVYSFK